MTALEAANGFSVVSAHDGTFQPDSWASALFAELMQAIIKTIKEKVLMCVTADISLLSTLDIKSI